MQPTNYILNTLRLIGLEIKHFHQVEKCKIFIDKGACKLQNHIGLRMNLDLGPTRKHFSGAFLAHKMQNCLIKGRVHTPKMIMHT